MSSDKNSYLPMELTDTFNFIGLASALFLRGIPTGRNYKWDSPLIPYKGDEVKMQAELALDDRESLFIKHGSDHIYINLTFFPEDQEMIKKALSEIEGGLRFNNTHKEFAIRIAQGLPARRSKYDLNFGYTEFVDGKPSIFVYGQDDKQPRLKELLQDLTGENLNPQEFAYDLLDKSYHRVSEYSQAKGVQEAEKKMFIVHKEIAKKRLTRVK